MSTANIGLLVVGHHGNTGSTLLATIALLEAEKLVWSDIPSSLQMEMGICPNPVIRCGGWDFTDGPLRDVLVRLRLVPDRLLMGLDFSSFPVQDFTPIATELDFERQKMGGRAECGDVGSAIAHIAADIEEFKSVTGIAHPIVIYLGSPARLAAPPLSEIGSWGDLFERAVATVPASLLYAAAAIEAGADFVDFTPSEALLAPALWGRSVQSSVQLAGRDGSTGQTMLKAAVASSLVIRGLRIRSWFSSNNLGNHDGIVLAQREFSELKIEDKKRGLSELLPYSDFDHVVSIDFVESRGDRKEAFDSVIAEDLFGQEVSLRLNWQGWDSALAVPMLLDLIRLLNLGQELGLSGVQSQLGFFFKAPLGIPCESPERGHQRLLRFYADRM